MLIRSAAVQSPGSCLATCSSSHLSAKLNADINVTVPRSLLFQKLMMDYCQILR